MRDYRVLEGLFFNEKDRETLREKIQNTQAGKRFESALLSQLEKEDEAEYPRFRFDWYAYNEDIDHSISVDNYQNINGYVPQITTCIARRAYHRMLACELLDKTEYRASIREDMLRIPKEYPLHVFVMCDIGLILSRFMTFFFAVLDGERALFSEEEQWILDNFARGVAMDVMSCQEEWLHSCVGQQHCNNHLVAHSQTAIAAGLYYHRKDWVKYGLENSEGIYVYLEDGMSDGGLGIEASLTYNLLSVSLMMETAEIMRRGGYKDDLYRRINKRGYGLKDYFAQAIECLAPQGRVIPMGDNYGAKTYLFDMDVFFKGCMAYGNEIPGMMWLAQRSQKESLSLERLLMGDVEMGHGVPKASTKIYEKFGMAVLKTSQGSEYWGDENELLAVRTGYGVIHGNCDHMGMLLFKGDRYLIRDFEGIDRTSKHVFSSDVTRTLNRSRLAHSAVMIDGMDTRAMNNVCLRTQYEEGDGWKKLTVTDDQGYLYEGVTMQRTLTLEKDRLRDVYAVSCLDERDIDYVIHAMADDAAQYEVREDILSRWFPKVWPCETMKWMFDAREEAICAEMKAEWPGVTMEMSAPGADKALWFALPEANDLSGQPSRSLIVRVHGRTARFEAVYTFS